MKERYILVFTGIAPIFKGQLLEYTENNNFEARYVRGEDVFDATVADFGSSLLPRIVKMLGRDTVQGLPCLVVYPAGSGWKAVFESYQISDSNKTRVLPDEVKQLFNQGLQDYDVLSSTRVSWEEAKQIIVDGAPESGKFFEYVILGDVGMVTDNSDSASSENISSSTNVESDDFRSEVRVLARVRKQKTDEEQADDTTVIDADEFARWEYKPLSDSDEQQYGNALNSGAIRRKQYDSRVIQRYLRKKTKNHVTTVASRD